MVQHSEEIASGSALSHSCLSKSEQREIQAQCEDIKVLHMGCYAPFRSINMGGGERTHGTDKRPDTLVPSSK